MTREFDEEGNSRSGVVPTYVIGPENIVFYGRTASLWHSPASNDNNRVKTRDKAVPEQATELFHRERAVQVLAVRCAKSSNEHTRPSYRQTVISSVLKTAY